MAVCHNSTMLNVGQNFQAAMHQFALVKSRHSSILDSSTVVLIDKCSSNFSYTSRCISKLSETTTTSWCNPCFRFFKNLEKKDNVSSSDIETLARYCTEARDISSAFKELSVHVRDIAGSFHDAEKRAERNAKEALEEVERMESNARYRRNEKDRAHDEAVQARKDADSTADGWKIAFWSTVWIPGVNVVTGTGALITNADADAAQTKEDDAYSEYCSAQRNLEYAQSKYREAQDALNDIRQLNEKLSKIQTGCEGMAAMVSSKANQFSSMHSRGKTNADLFELGLHQEAIAEEIKWISGIKQDLEECVQSLKKANAVQVPAITPKKLYINLPSLGLSIQ